MYVITRTDEGFFGDVIAVTDNAAEARRMLEVARMDDTRKYAVAYMGTSAMRAVYNKVKSDIDGVAVPF